MSEEVDVLGHKLPREAVFDEDGKLKVLGYLIIFAYVSAFLRWCGEHPDVLKEMFYERC